MTASPWLPWQLRWRLLRLRGADIRSSAIIHGNVIIKSNRLTIGSRVFINSGVILDNGAGVIIEDDVAIGPGAKIITSTHVIGASTRRASDVTGGRVVIERGAWIGAAAIILPGVTIARGSVIGAGALVTKDTEPDGLYVGSPARRVRDLAE